jgi:hypothetical protein
LRRVVSRLAKSRRTWLLEKEKEEEVQKELQEMPQDEHLNRTENGRFPSERSQGRVSGSRSSS